MKNFDSEKTFAASDLAILRFYKGELQVFLVQLRFEPFEGVWGLPGSLVRSEENLVKTSQRIFFEATGEMAEKKYFEQVYTFSDIGRDPRSRSISTAYFAVFGQEGGGAKPCEKYLAGEWVEIKKAMKKKLAYDHVEILKKVFERMGEDILSSTLALAFLPREFRFQELQDFYEVCLGKSFDKRNFRKKILAMEIVEETGKVDDSLSSRPAKLFTAKEKKVVKLVLFK